MSPTTAPRLDHVRVSEAMRPGIVSCPPDTPLRTMAHLMATHHIHALVVPEVEGDGVAGWAIASDLDVVAAAATGDVERLTAGDVAGHEALTVSDDEQLDRAMQRMGEHEANHLVVVGAASGRPTGILSTLDVAAVLSIS